MSREAPLERIAWLLNRLRCMPPGEPAYRIQQAALRVLEQRGVLRFGAEAPRDAASALPPAETPALAAQEIQSLLADAEAVRVGRVTLFAGRRFDVGPAPDWNRDPLAGDIRHVWELNRHLQLVRLAQAWRISGDGKWIAALRAQVGGWLDQCPPTAGPNWASPLEMGIRLINWALVWQLAGGQGGALFDGADGQGLRRAWLASIHAHCQCIARHLSRHSSANNHLIGELAGLYVATLAWPCWDQSARWRAQAARELGREAVVQFSLDGVNREQAFSYHVFACEFLFVAGLAGQAAGQPFPQPWWAALARALRFLRSVRDTSGKVPMVGDADDGAAYRLDPAGHDRAGHLLALGAAAFGGHGGQDLGVRWLLHALPGPRPCSADPAPGTGWAFPDGGYLLFGSACGEADEIRGMLDCGPLGYLGIAAHGHADALALSLSVAGEECLVDPGTYSYWQGREWRDYFRGTSAHNTVRVDGADQSSSGGRFMWLRKARTRIERMPASPQAFHFRGSHDGYLRLPDPARHVREVRFDAAAATLQVRDSVEAKRAHRVELFWHFAPALAVERSANGVRVRGKRFALELEIAGEGATLALVRGQLEPPLGWYSRSYESRQPCPVLRIVSEANGAQLESRFKISFF